MNVLVFEMALKMAAFDFELPTDLLGAIGFARDGTRESEEEVDTCKNFTALLGDIAAFPTLDDEFQMDEDRLAHVTKIYEDAKKRCCRLEDAQIQHLRQTFGRLDEDNEEDVEAFAELLKRMLGISDLATDVLGPTDVLEDLCREAAFLDFLESKN